MCGICGLAYSDRSSVDPVRLAAMRDVLSHRGPDDAGLWTHPGVGLAHRRLSIIDLTAGKQPLANESGDVWVTFNGEIYNYRELRAYLVNQGHHFRTQSDTEVLVHGYEEWGEDLPIHLNGIFAFALYDCTREQLLLARDHLGVKPLFWALHDGEFAFASETRALLRTLDIPARPSRAAVQEYLTFRYLAGEQSFFDNVHRLPPGCVGIWRDGKFSTRSYWNANRIALAPAVSLKDAVEIMDLRLDTAVRRQLMSDVPLGAFLSGGIDSGLTTYYAVRNTESADFHTYSVALEEKAWDETKLACGTARALGTTHEVSVASVRSVRDGILSLLQFGDEPLSHPNMVPLLELSRRARQGVTVVLTGEGADEVFCGYPRYHVYAARERLAILGRPVRTTLGNGLGLLPGHRIHKFARAVRWPLGDAALFNSAFVDPDLVAELTGASLDDALLQRRAILEDSEVPGDPVATVSRYETATYLVSALERLDRVSMAVGLEARVPFLDLDLVEWGTALPSNIKMRQRKNKVVLRQLASGKLDDRILAAPKSGFGLPLDDWFRRDEFRCFAQSIGERGHPAGEYLNEEVVRRIRDEHLQGRRNHGELMWLLANLYLWFDVHDAQRVPGLLQEQRI